jgi:hypothetical protein
MQPDKLISFTRLIESLNNGSGTPCYFQKDIHFLFHIKYGSWHAWRFALLFNHIELKS